MVEPTHEEVVEEIKHEESQIEEQPESVTEVEQRVESA